MVFCNSKNNGLLYKKITVTILILVDGFLQYAHGEILPNFELLVTILILVDGFLQYKER